MNITVYCGSSVGSRQIYQDATVKLGTWIGENGHTLVYGGGRVGLMNLLAGTVKEHGGKVIGVIPDFLDSKEGHRDDIDQLISVESMSDRKRKMLELGDAFIALPGSVGTLDEISQVMALISVDQLFDACIFYNVDGFYEPLRSMLDRMVVEGFMKQKDREKFRFCYTMDEIEQEIPKKTVPEQEPGSGNGFGLLRDIVDSMSSSNMGSTMLKAGRVLSEGRPIGSGNALLDTSFNDVLTNDKAKAFLDDHIPERAQKYILNPLVRSLTLRQVLTHMPGLSDEKKRQIVADLEKIMQS